MSPHNTSSIYSDLKRFAGKIEAKKVSAMAELDSENERVKQVLKKNNMNMNSDSESESDNESDDEKPIQVKKTRARKIEAPTPPEITIESISAMVKEPLMPLRDINGIVHDTSTIAIKCAHGHIHKYFIKDILKDNGTSLKCITCSSGNKFMIMVRELAENILGLPFALNDKRIDSEANSIEYINPVIKLVLACSRVSGNDCAIKSGDYILMKLHPTTSLKKVKESLHAHLMQFETQLPANYIEKIKELKEVKVEKRTRKAVIRQKDPLPFTPELATLQIANSSANPIIAQMQMNVIDNSQLYIENC